MKALINKIKNYFVTQPTLPLNHVWANNFHTLESRLEGAIQFLKKKSTTLHGKKISLSQLPWFLLIGSVGSGKTTLLANSNIKFILGKKIKADKLHSLPLSQNYDLWTTPNAVLLDIPGNFTAYSDEGTTEQNKLWWHLLALIQKFRGKQALRGVVISLSIAELMDKLNRQQIVENLGDRIMECREKFGAELPFYFCITKCDLLPGFLEFFSDSGSDELSQSWGVTLPPSDSNISTMEIFINRFNVLIKRLNKQLIWRLHQEPSAFAKLSIKDFPLQIERFKDEFADLIRRLEKDNVAFYLNGVYLTSAIQHPINEQKTPPQTVVATHFQNPLVIMQTPTLPIQSYFVRQFILQAITSTEVPPAKTSNWHLGNIAAGLIVSIIIFSLFVHNYKSSPSSTLIAQNKVTPLTHSLN